MTLQKISDSDYFKRDIETKMIQWKEKAHKVLMIEGARQVGKTTTIEHFGMEHYKNFIKINLTEPAGKRFIQMLENTPLALDRLLSQYCNEEQKTFTNSKDTLLFIDEIQENETVFSAIRTMNRTLQCDTIVSGSYLKRAEKFFYPAGDMEVLTMHVMSFPEFISVWGARDYYEKIDLFQPDKSRFEWFQTAYHNYCIIGGYPSAVHIFKKTGTLADVREAQAEILQVLGTELANNIPFLNTDRLTACLRGIIEISLKNKRGDMRLIKRTPKNDDEAENQPKDAPGKIKNLLEILQTNYEEIGYSKKELYQIISWLDSCKTIGYCGKYDYINDTRNENMRFYLNDLGMLSYLAELFSLDSDDYTGLVSETFVFHSLTFQKFSEKFIGTTPDFGIAGDKEYDFVVTSRFDHCRYTIEVKSGKNSNKNLRELLEHQRTDFIVNFKGNSGSGKNGQIVTLPIWLAYRFEYNLGKAAQPDDAGKLTEMTPFHA